MREGRHCLAVTLWGVGGLTRVHAKAKGKDKLTTQGNGKQ